MTTATPTTGQPDQEVFLYDAAAEGGAGTLVCASCNPTGARPQRRPLPASVATPPFDERRPAC